MLTMGNDRTVFLFGISGVLNDHSLSGYLETLSSKSGGTDATFTVAAAEDAALFENASITLADFESRIAEKLRLPVAEVSYANYYSSSVKPNLEVMGMAAELKAQGFTIAYLTNHDPAVHRIAAAQLVQTFEIGFASYQILGLRKPDELAFKFVADRIGARLGRLLRYGDITVIESQERNVEGARKAGMRGIMYTTPAALRDELNAVISQNALKAAARSAPPARISLGRIKA